MKFPPISIPKEGWRRTGLMNLIWSTLNSTTIILQGNCQKAHRANSVLHFLISITSTLILASSRFFMQVLSSPSRLEINRAHLQLRSLEIGISSMKNIPFISRYKAIGWAILLISSTPIHLLFSSSVFETRFQNSDWRLTVASGSFSTQQVAFFPPGASLTNAGAESITWNSSLPDHTCQYVEGYGEHHYASCRPKNEYRDVVIVVDTKADNPEGWTRSQVFSDPSNILGPIWNPHIPRNDLNSLWYSTQCTTNLPTAIGFPDDWRTARCISTCGRVLGFKSISIPTNETALSESDWIIDLHRPSPCSTPNEKRYGYNDSFNSFPVRYCLAEPSPISSCQVGLSNILLLVTTGCVFLKAFICTLVVVYLPHTSLVTLGDALESFISDPDPVTMGLGTFNIYDSHRIQFGQFADAETESATNLSDTARPRLWNRGTNRLISIVPKWAWSGTLIPIVCFICIGAYYAKLIVVFDRVSLQGTIGVSESPFFINGLLKERYLVDNYNKDSWSPGNKWGITEGTIILLGFWPLGILIALLAGLALAIFPIIYGIRRLPGDMVFGACDSLVLSAACHPHIPSSASLQDGLNTRESPDSEGEETSKVTKYEPLRELSRGKLRWGVTRLPSGLSTSIDLEQNIMHLSFTREDEYISKPVDNSLYV
ncbi:hypothetical protein F5Y00DRAFT_252254 [Daldinia vernicosa]|uniref:uncharacterized protein n=1 Tax=Daldinia vernicosa TaxID=114800 RepID=UPI002007A6B6|nr:uncharacterized protein F5Y00DRAFT_252254 [Daldinia vernicosa]KAI0850563.1 hypothetical protein F5Y00DRAFT_252254 [Daldinia vernicosa]